MLFVSMYMQPTFSSSKECVYLQLLILGSAGVLFYVENIVICFDVQK